MITSNISKPVSFSADKPNTSSYRDGAVILSFHNGRCTGFILYSMFTTSKVIESVLKYKI